MMQTDVVVIGAGHAGLAVSRLLTDRGVDHVVLERGRTAQRWRSRSWKSLRLLTPNWMTRLPGWRYHGTDPSGFMPAADVARYLKGYAASFDAPVRPDARVDEVRRCGGRYRVVSTAGSFSAPAVVIATGACDRPAVPHLATDLDPGVLQLTPDTYRSPADLPRGGVLVVGASASGAQLADEIHASGRDVVLAVGRHGRATRHYRGLDLMWWLDAMGTMNHPLHPRRRHPEPSLQLVGDRERTVDLPSLSARGIRLAGRLLVVDGGGLHFADDLLSSAAVADARFERMLRRIDDYAAATGLEREVEPADGPFRRLERAGLGHLRRGEIGTVVWATGYRRRYPWLRVPVCDVRGELRQENGRTPAPGLFVVGLPNQTRHSSTLIDGVRFDAESVVDALAGSDLSNRRWGRAS